MNYLNKINQIREISQVVFLGSNSEEIKDLIRFCSLPDIFLSLLRLKRSRLVLLLCPDMISMEDLGTSSRFDRYWMHILLAASSTGGAVSLIFNASPCWPAIMFFEDRGWTKTLSMIPLMLSWRKVIFPQNYWCKMLYFVLKNLVPWADYWQDGSALAYYVKKYKFQAPNYKQISNSNTQWPKPSRTTLFGYLNFGHWDLFALLNKSKI